MSETENTANVEIRRLSEPPRDHNGPGLPVFDEVAWYMTQDDKLLGIVVRDKVDNDFKWVIMRESGGAWEALDLGKNWSDSTTATAELHQAMKAAFDKAG
jgi:hypothetical protein